MDELPRITLPTPRVQRARWMPCADGSYQLQLCIRTSVSPSSVCGKRGLYKLIPMVQVDYRDACVDLTRVPGARSFDIDVTYWRFSVISDYRTYERHRMPMYDIRLTGMVDSNVGVKSGVCRIRADDIKDMGVLDCIHDHISDGLL